ncbi:MAG: LysR family transcriptional regulator [Candidatus Eremiobacteraeota bacterium]|nr:LysR family transcriptional regulator [Candidatus Eremiobacteraeota bacterium]
MRDNPQMDEILPFSQMQVFLKVVETGSFTAAAESLGLTKSSTSRQVTALEKRLGVRLLHRSTRSLRLTNAGEVYFERAKTALCDILDLECLVADFGSEPVGRLRITCPGGFASCNSEMFGSFAVKNPKVSLQIEETDRFTDVIGEGFDFAFRGGRTPDPSLVGERLATHEMGLLASSDYLEHRGIPESVAALPEHDLVLLATSTRRTWSLRRGKTNTEIDAVGRLAVNNLRAVWNLVAEGVGIGLLPLTSQSAPLVRVLEEWKGEPAEVWLVYPTARQMASATQAFLEHVRDSDIKLF